MTGNELLERLLKELGSNIKGKIPTIIWEQMTYGTTRKSIVGSWGTSNVVGTKRGLNFNVQGALFTGQVEIELTYADDYSVTFKEGNKIVKVLYPLYIDNLVEEADLYIETRADG